MLGGKSALQAVVGGGRGLKESKESRIRIRIRIRVVVRAWVFITH